MTTATLLPLAYDSKTLTKEEIRAIPLAERTRQVIREVLNIHHPVNASARAARALRMADGAFRGTDMEAFFREAAAEDMAR